MATVGTLDGVMGCRGVRGGTDVRRSSWVERSRIIVRWCTDRLTALLTETLTALLTDEPVERFFGSTINQRRAGAVRQLTATLTDPAHSPVSGRARSERRGS